MKSGKQSITPAKTASQVLASWHVMHKDIVENKEQLDYI
jgi:hypothetical protein